MSQQHEETKINAWLVGAVERLLRELQPERIVLFGSRARGSATRHSDIDLFVLMETTASPIDRIGHILTILADSPAPLEVVAFTPREFERIRHRPFIRTVISEGKVLYERRTA